MRLFLRSDFTTKYLQSRQPTFVPAAEAVEETIPFLARYFLRWHNYPPLSNSSRECLWRFTSLPQRVTFERLQRAGFVKVNDGVELIRQACFEVVALPFSLRQIDHANRAFQLRIAKRNGRRGVVT